MQRSLNSPRLAVEMSREAARLLRPPQQYQVTPCTLPINSCMCAQVCLFSLMGACGERQDVSLLA